MEATIATPRRTIKVERLEIIKSGNGKKGQWILFKVHATELDGTPINDELRTFDGNLGVGTDGIVTVDADAFTQDGEIKNYTLKAVKPSGGVDPQDKDGRIGELESRVTKLERQLKAIIGNRDLEI